MVTRPTNEKAEEVVPPIVRLERRIENLTSSVERLAEAFVQTTRLKEGTPVNPGDSVPSGAYVTQPAVEKFPEDRRVTLPNAPGSRRNYDDNVEQPGIEGPTSASALNALSERGRS